MKERKITVTVSMMPSIKQMAQDNSESMYNDIRKMSEYICSLIEKDNKRIVKIKKKHGYE